MPTNRQNLPRRAAIAAAVTIVASATGVTVLAHGGSAPQIPTATLAATAPLTTGPTPGATASATAAPSARPSRSATAKAAPAPTKTTRTPGPSLKAAAATADGSVAVAVADLTTGATLSYGATKHRFIDASIAKVDILATLLLQRQRQGDTLDAAERALAVRMIEQSDNNAANSLYTAIGFDSGLDEANRRFGLTSTRGGSGLRWGLTSTTAADQLRLLRTVFTGSSALSTSSRRYLQSLMGQVEEGQRWGVGAAARGSESDDFALKNGWLPRSASGLWTINSIGQVRRDGHLLLISVVSDGNRSEAAGIALVESVATAAAADATRT